MIVLLISCFFIGWLVGAKQEQKRQSKIKIVEPIDIETKKIYTFIKYNGREGIFDWLLSLRFQKKAVADLIEKGLVE